MKKFISFALMALCSMPLWSAEFSSSDIVKSGGTTTDHVTCSSGKTETSKKKVKNVSNIYCVAIANVVDTATNTGTEWVQIQADENYTLDNSLIIQGAANGSDDKNIAVLMWLGDYNATAADTCFTAVAPENDSGTRDTISLKFPSGRFRTIRLYRRINYKNGTIGKSAVGSGYQYPSSNASSFNVQSITATATNSNSFTITYDANGGSGSMQNSTNTVSECTFTYTNKDFVEWNTASDGTGDSYAPGDDATSDLDLYAIWEDHALSTDATLSNLTVDGITVTGFAAGTIEYNVELPFGTSVVPTVAATANSAYAKSVVITQAASVSGTATVVVTAEDNSTTKTYTINFSVPSSKDIIMVWVTGKTLCNSEAGYVNTSVILSTNDAVKDYLTISFEQATETEDNKAAEKSGSYLSTGKAAGNLVKIIAKSGFAFKAMGFYGKIETSEVKCPVSIDGGTNWIDVTGTLGSDASHCDVFTDEETTQIILKNNAGKGTWIRHMELTIVNHTEPGPGTALDNTADETKAIKRIENGMLIIEKNGVRYNAQGQVIR